MHLLKQAIWGLILKCTAEKSQTNAANMTMLLLGQAIWGGIWKRTVEKSQTNATNVTLPLLRQAIWGHIWKRTVEKSQINAANVTLPLLCHVIMRRHLKTHWRKVKLKWHIESVTKQKLYILSLWMRIFSANENGTRKKLCCCSVLLKCCNLYWFILPSGQVDW